MIHSLDKMGIINKNMYRDMRYEPKKYSKSIFLILTHFEPNHSYERFSNNEKMVHVSF